MDEVKLPFKSRRIKGDPREVKLPFKSRRIKGNPRGGSAHQEFPDTSRRRRDSTRRDRVRNRLGDSPGNPIDSQHPDLAWWQRTTLMGAAGTDPKTGVRTLDGWGFDAVAKGPSQYAIRKKGDGEGDWYVLDSSSMELSDITDLAGDAIKGVGSGLGATWGGFKGLAAGSGLGTLLFPGPGTAVGGVAGGITGAGLGSAAGGATAEAALMGIGQKFLGVKAEPEEYGSSMGQEALYGGLFGGGGKALGYGAKAAAPKVKEWAKGVGLGQKVSRANRAHPYDRAEAVSKIHGEHPEARGRIHGSGFFSEDPSVRSKHLLELARKLGVKNVEVEVSPRNPSLHTDLSGFRTMPLSLLDPNPVSREAIEKWVKTQKPKSLEKDMKDLVKGRVPEGAHYKVAKEIISKPIKEINEIMRGGGEIPKIDTKRLPVGKPERADLDEAITDWFNRNQPDAVPVGSGATPRYNAMRALLDDDPKVPGFQNWWRDAAFEGIKSVKIGDQVFPVQPFVRGGKVYRKEVLDHTNQGKKKYNPDAHYPRRHAQAFHRAITPEQKHVAEIAAKEAGDYVAKPGSPLDVHYQKMVMDETPNVAFGERFGPAKAFSPTRPMEFGKWLGDVGGGMQRAGRGLAAPAQATYGMAGRAADKFGMPFVGKLPKPLRPLAATVGGAVPGAIGGAQIGLPGPGAAVGAGLGAFGLAGQGLEQLGKVVAGDAAMTKVVKDAGKWLVNDGSGDAIGQILKDPASPPRVKALLGAFAKDWNKTTSRNTAAYLLMREATFREYLRQKAEGELETAQ